MTSLPELSELTRQRRNVENQLAACGGLRPGSLTARYRKCGSKPTCHCSAEGDPGHGRSWPRCAVSRAAGHSGAPARSTSPPCRGSGEPIHVIAAEFSKATRSVTASAVEADDDRQKRMRPRERIS